MHFWDHTNQQEESLYIHFTPKNSLHRTMDFWYIFDAENRFAALFRKCCMFGRDLCVFCHTSWATPKLWVGKFKKILKNSEIVIRPHQSARTDFRYISYPKKISMTTWHLGSTLWALLCCPGHFTENVVCLVGSLWVFCDSSWAPKNCGLVNLKKF